MWEGAIVPEVALVGEAVSDEAELTLLHVLLDRVEVLLLGDLRKAFYFSICHARNFYGEKCVELTSSLPLVHLGISTIMFRTVCSWLA